MTLRGLTKQLRKERKSPPEGKKLTWGDIAEGKLPPVEPKQHLLLSEQAAPAKPRPKRRARLSFPAVAASVDGVPDAKPQPAMPTVPLLFPGDSPAHSVGLELESLRLPHPKLYESLRGLDPAQLSAVLSEEASVLVRAPVGSGKTRVLVHRAVYLNRVRGVPFTELSVLTFTNRAADEIRARIVALSEPGQVPERGDLWLTGTFHSVARALLREVLPLERIGYRPDFAVLDDDACEELLDALIQKHKLRIQYRKKLRLRLRCTPPGEVAPDDLAKLAPLYATEKQSRGLMDFDDLMVNATSLLASARGAYALPLGGLIIDEMQDCEPRELLFLKELRGAATFFGVGDPNQAIYGFRGGAPHVFDRAASEFGCSVHALPVNYRSTRTIVDVARSVLSLAQSESGGEIRATREQGGQVTLYRHHNPLSEALYLALRLTELHRGGVPYSEMAVLFRVRAQAEILRETLTARGVPCAESEEMSEEAVRLLTLHSAKGLEFRWVFLSGINDGLLPLGRSRADADDAEERRLLFVGMTRASCGLEISYHTEPHQIGARGAISPYLRWLPTELVERHDSPETLTPPRGPQAVAFSTPPPRRGDLELREAHVEEAPGSGYAIGVRVRHPRYGLGVVTASDDSQVACDFGKLGVRSFPLALCPLSLVQDPPAE